MKCEYCGKELSILKGEHEHGCLSCHGMPFTYTIHNLQQQLKAANSRVRELMEKNKELSKFIGRGC